MTTRRITCESRNQRDSIIESFTVRNEKARRTRRLVLDVALVPCDLDILITGNRSHVPLAATEVRFLLEEQDVNAAACETCGLIHDGPICLEQY